MDYLLISISSSSVESVPGQRYVWCKGNGLGDLRPESISSRFPVL